MGDEMEKYAVDTEETEDKVASDSSKCPVCRAPITIENGIRRCPVHGTAPFER